MKFLVKDCIYFGGKGKEYICIHGGIFYKHFVDKNELCVSAVANWRRAGIGGSLCRSQLPKACRTLLDLVYATNKNEGECKIDPSLLS